MTRLKALDLRAYWCEDDDLKDLAKLTDLELLSLSGSPVTGKGLEKLAPLTKLKYLNLRGTNVAVGDLQKLDKDRLTEVIVVQSLVRLADRAAAERALPGVRIKVARAEVPGRSINPDMRPEYMYIPPNQPGKGGDNQFPWLKGYP
jgi:hypothetical protein